MRRNIFAATLLLFTLVGMPLHATEIKVFAAASLTDAMQTIARNYQAKTSDHIRFNFAGSNVLARQIEQGAPVDIFFSADEAQMNAVAKAGLIVDASRRDVLSNTLVVIAPEDSKLTITSVRDLARLEFKRIALGDPRTVPAGVYSRAYLQRLGIWDRLASRVIPTANVRAALAAVESDNADVGIVYGSDAKMSKRAKVILTIPRAEGPKIAYPAALLKTASGDAAGKFLAYLESPEALAVFQRDGFLPSGG